ncbi:MAG: hypothetical protein ABSB67_20235 [Bryobacteraceae bacterium]
MAWPPGDSSVVSLLPACDNEVPMIDERAFYRETETTKPISLTCPMCRTAESYDLKWLVRTKLAQLPRGADERDRAKFAKAASYMVLLDDKVMCKNMRCRKRFDISGIKTTAFI